MEVLYKNDLGGQVGGANKDDRSLAVTSRFTIPITSSMAHTSPVSSRLTTSLISGGNLFIRMEVSNVLYGTPRVRIALICISTESYSRAKSLKIMMRCDRREAQESIHALVHYELHVSKFPLQNSHSFFAVGQCQGQYRDGHQHRSIPRTNSDT